MKQSNSPARRRFLKKLTLGIGSSSLFATQGKLQLMQSAMAASSDYSNLTDHKSLVCVFLFGGNDAFNMMVPYGQEAYQQYQNARTGIAIPHDKLLSLKGGEQAFHPAMPDLQQLYNSDKLAVATNVGAIIEPTSRAAYKQESVRLPADLFSHSHQQEFWETGTTAKNSVHPPGWGGRMMDMLISANTNPSEPALFSLAGNSVWQRGLKPLDFVLNPYDGANQIEDFVDDTWPRWKNSRVNAWKKIRSMQSQSPLQQYMGEKYVRTDERITHLITEIAKAQKVNTTFPEDNGLALQLKMAAKMISIRENLGMKRQIFFIGFGGWDSHGNQLSEHASQLKKLNDALNSFYKTTEELGVADSVTTFTASEFGRTMSINGDGTDHAWASHQLIMGGAVQGGKIHGIPMDLTVAGPTDAEDTGRFIPQHSVDQYAATLANWMGMSTSEVDGILPNLKNFNPKSMDFMI